MLVILILVLWCLQKDLKQIIDDALKHVLTDGHAQSILRLMDNDAKFEQSMVSKVAQKISFLMLEHRGAVCARLHEVLW